MRKGLFHASVLAVSMASVGIASLGAASLAHAGNLYIGPALFLQDNTSKDANFRGVHPRLSLGYADVFEDIYLAAELFAVPVMGTIADNRNTSMSVRSTRSFGASFIPGFSLTDTVMGFFRLGVVSTLFSSPNTTRTGGQFGAGLQFALTPCWDMRAEYNYTAYRTAAGIGAVKADEAGIGFVYKILG